MSGPDFNRMTKQEVILEPMQPAAEQPSGRPDTPMLLASIRMPVTLVEQLDEIARALGVRRSDVIREALSDYVARTVAPVERDEAEHALDVLRRIVAGVGADHRAA